MNNLAWVDIETTGLDPNKDEILEIALVITNSKLEILYEASFPIYHDFENLRLTPWCYAQHTSSGLLEDVKSTDSYFMLDAVQNLMVETMDKYCSDKSSPMCGNSVCFDRRFLAVHMPELEQRFHYRNLDVSTLKICAQLWAPNIFDSIAKREGHRALADIRESIGELKQYKEALFQND